MNEAFKMLLFCFFLQGGLCSVSTAAPSGGVVVRGEAVLTQSDLNTTIDQTSQRLAIDWQTFNVSRNESVRFNQPDVSSIALNRILDQNVSQIHGAIDANGQIVLVNPNGIFFGEHATVNVGGLFASGLDISPEDFMAGRLDFRALENTRGLIVNGGTLRVIDGGTLALLGQQVRNEGLLVANFGTVALAAGSDIQVSFDEYEHLSIRINQNRLADILDIDDPAIFNSGLIQGHGGRVVLNARQAEAIQSSIVNVDDRDRFSSASGQVIAKDGGYYFTGPDGDISDLGTVDVSTESGDAGTVVYAGRNIDHSGTVNADSQDGNGGNVSFDASDTTMLSRNSRVSAQSHKNGKGGTVHVLGKHVGLIDRACINASGANGGGEVLVGGDYLGSNSDIKNAEAVYLGENTRIDANGIDNGDGGKIIVWSDNATRAYGKLGATGGQKRGDGGFIETSSKNYVDLMPDVDVHAVNGTHGEWLIDPTNIVISNSFNSNISGLLGGPIFSSSGNSSNLNVSTLQNALRAGANITVRTTVITSTVDTPYGCVGIACTGSTTVDLQSEAAPVWQLGYSAGGNINIGTASTPVDIDFDGVGTNVDGNNASSLTLQAHRDINIYGRIYDSNATYSTEDILNLTLTADWAGNASVGTSPQGAGNVNIYNDIDLQGGNFTATGVNFVSNTAAAGDYYDIITALPPGFTADPNPAGNVSITMTGNVVLGSVIADGDLNVEAGTSGSVSIRDSLTINGNADISAGNAISDANTDVTDSIVIVGTTDLSGSTISIDHSDIDFQNSVSVNNGTTVSIADRNNLAVNINNNSVTSIATNTGADATINDIDPAGTVLAAMTVGGNLDVHAAGSITDSGVITINNNGTGNGNGVSEFRVPDGRSVILDAVDTNATDTNTLRGTLNFIANSGAIADLVIADSTAFTLQDGINLSGAMNLRASDITLNSFTLGATDSLILTSTDGDIDQTTAITHTGPTILSASGNINLDQVNSLSQVQIDQAGTATLNNGANALELTGVAGTDTLNITATGGITDTGSVVAANASLDAGSSAITLDNPGNDFDNVHITAAGAVTLQDTDSINVAGSMSSLSVTAGQGGAAAVISNVQDSILDVSGLTRLTLANGGDIDLANFTTADRNNLQSTLQFVSGTGSLDNVSVRNSADVELAALNVTTSLDLDSLGAITQTGAWINTGDASLQAASINLGQANDFNTLTITDSNAVLINDVAGDISVTGNNSDPGNQPNSIDLTLTAVGNVDINGQLLSLDITTSGGDVSNASSLQVDNSTRIDAGSGNVDFETQPVNLNDLDLAAANDVRIIDTDGINLAGNVNSLSVQTQAGDMGSAGALRVSGATVLDAAAGSADITLDNAGNDFNSLRLSARNATINDQNALALADVDVDSLDLTSGGNLGQLAGTVIDVSGAATLDAGTAEINLGEANRFNSLAINAARASIVNAQAITLNDSTLSDRLSVTTQAGSIRFDALSAGNLIELDAADALIDNNGNGANLIADTAMLHAANGIGMVGGDSSDIDTRLVHLQAHNSSSGDININNSGGDLTLDDISNDATDSGNFNLQSSDDVYVDNIRLVKNLTDDFTQGTINMFTSSGSFLGVGPLDPSTADITGSNLRLVGVRGTLGTLQRPMVLDISGKVDLLMRASLQPIYLDPAPRPEDIEDNSLIQFTSADTLAAVNGVQVTEVETLLDISPAIFTDIRHFVVSENPLLLPRDQLYENGYDQEDDEEFFRRVMGDELIEQVN